MVSLGKLPDGSNSVTPTGLSADGSVVVGQSGAEAYRWTVAAGMVGLGDFKEGDPNFSEATGVSADGSVVVGWAASAAGNEAFRWTEADGMVGLGDLPGGRFDSEAIGVSADGRVIVGLSKSAVGDELFVWDVDNGMRSLQDMLVNTLGLDVTGWFLPFGFPIVLSSDGETIIGPGLNPNTQSEGWIAQIDALSVPLSGCIEVDTLGDSSDITGTAKLKFRGPDEESFSTISDGAVDQGCTALDITGVDGPLDSTEGKFKMVFSNVVFPEFFSGVVRTCFEMDIGPAKATLRRKVPKDGFKITTTGEINAGCLEFQESFDAEADDVYKLVVKWPQN